MAEAQDPENRLGAIQPAKRKRGRPKGSKTKKGPKHTQPAGFNKITS